MIKRIIWSDFAETQLDDIYDYYKRKISKKVATNLVRGIVNASTRLIETPYIGQEEELLKDRKVQYRYMVFKNYKLIYSVNEENGTIKIADFFDTRQNPPKMKRTK